MKRLIPIIILLLGACSSREATNKLLTEVWTKDQSVRHATMRLTKAVTTEGRTDLIDSLIMAVEAQEKADIENISIIDSLLQKGLPHGLTADSYNTIWIVIDHASLEKQEQYLPMIEQMAKNRLIEQDRYAILFDRVAMKQNHPQRYGSQTVQFGNLESMQLYVWPVENPANIDSLRASVEMGAIADYLEQLKSATGLEAKFDPTMSVDEINKLRQANN